MPRARSSAGAWPSTPTFAPAWATRAGIRVREGRFMEANRDIVRAMELRPGNVGDTHNRAVIWTALGKYDRAVRDYEAVLREDPGSAGTRNNLAWLLATARDPRVRDGPRALTYAREALASRRQPAWLDTLAAAHAECGDFGRAIAAEEEALRLSDPPNERFRRRLGGYRLGLSLVDQRAVHGPA
jgi:Flp pilus assembly protein TadD